MTRVLRIALIQSNRIVEDRTFAAKARVSVGEHASSTFMTPGRVGVTRPVPIFTPCRDRYVLTWPLEMRGTVRLPDGVRALDELEQGLVLPTDSSGLLQLEKSTLVFQFVEQAAPARPLSRPPEARGGLIAQIDRGFAAVLAASLVAHFAGAGWLVAQPLPHDDEVVDAALDRFATQVRLPPPAPAPAPAAPRSTQPTVGTQPQRAAQAQVPPTKRPLSEAVSAAGLLRVLGTNRGEPSSALVDLLGSREADLSHALSGLDGARIASIDEVTQGATRGGAAGVIQSAEVVTTGTRDFALVERRDHLKVHTVVEPQRRTGRPYPMGSSPG